MDTITEDVRYMPWRAALSTVGGFDAWTRAHPGQRPQAVAMIAPLSGVRYLVVSFRATLPEARRDRRGKCWAIYAIEKGQSFLVGETVRGYISRAGAWSAALRMAKGER